MNSATATFLILVQLCFCLINARRIPKPRELESDYWNEVGQKTLQNILNLSKNENVAKNVIFFLGDGMGIPTVTAGRILEGQLRGLSGEENFLSFEKFPDVALSKTYNVDKQVPDSAGTATAFCTGVKGNYNTIGVTSAVKLNDCEASLHPKNKVSTVAKWAQDVGKSTGVVTTMRVSHATPAGLYASVANREWESDSNTPKECADIVSQLVHGDTGKNFQVIMGGGKKHFLPKDVNGTRLKDNMIKQWLEKKESAKFVQTAKELLEIDVSKTDYLLGLFNADHLSYELDKKNNITGKSEPSIVEMTEQAIKILQKNSKGYYLMVEGGKIDWAHHSGNAKRALYETIYFNKAIEKALEMTSTEDTLIIVTADHSHTMTINGYPDRGHNILGLINSGENSEPYSYLGYTTLMYTNGPGYRNESAMNVSNEDTEADDFHQMAAIPRNYETHGGEDVAIYAQGPMSHLFRGVVEQNYIAHAIAYASCLKGDKCNSNNEANILSFTWINLLMVLVGYFFQKLNHF